MGSMLTTKANASVYKNLLVIVNFRTNSFSAVSVKQGIHYLGIIKAVFRLLPNLILIVWFIRRAQCLCARCVVRVSSLEIIILSLVFIIMLGLAVPNATPFTTISAFYV